MGFYKNTGSGTYNISDEVKGLMYKVVYRLTYGNYKHTSKSTFYQRGAHRCRMGKRHFNTYVCVLWDLKDDINSLMKKEAISFEGVMAEYVYVRFYDKALEDLFASMMWDK